MDFECDCGTVAKNVPIKANLYCQDCGRRYALTLYLTRKKEDDASGPSLGTSEAQPSPQKET